MGAFGSCLGIGRPMKPGANPRLLRVEANHFGASGNPGANGVRVPLGSRAPPPPPNSRPNTYLGHNGSAMANGKSPMPKLLRQSSSLSSGQQQQLPSLSNITTVQSQVAAVQKLVDIDDNPPLPFDKPTLNGRLQVTAATNGSPAQVVTSSHLICNRKQQSANSNGLINLTENGIPSQLQPQTQEKTQLSASNLFMQNFLLNPNDTRVLIALYDYDVPKSSEDLSFRKGELLETTLSLMTGDWWLSRSKSTQKIGYVPSNYVAEHRTDPWFLGKIGRAEAERRLKMPENRDGAFIIRASDTAPNQFSLSLRHEDHVKHYKIKKLENNCFYISKKRVFSTLQDLVMHYSNDMDGLCINLREPCTSRLDKPVLASLSHDTCDKWEIDKRDLTLLHELGRGQFGQVFEGLYRNATRVAIKTLRKGSMDPQDFLGEAQIMKKMKHPNLVQLYAVCTREEPVYIITELMSKGALINYLQTPEGKTLSLVEYINMATQIAAGMSYLEKESFVHRDLAARNILVGDNNVCKIADFGLARFIRETEYEARAGAKFPIKWTAPEAANFSRFTIKSDVWSFGIVLYEIITKGGTPYPDMTNAEVLSRIDKGYKMQKPPGCEEKYYSIMIQCWNKDPMKRPTFEALFNDLSEYFTSDQDQYRLLIAP